VNPPHVLYELLIPLAVELLRFGLNLWREHRKGKKRKRSRLPKRRKP